MNCTNCSHNAPSGDFFDLLVKSKLGVKDGVRVYYNVIRYKCKQCGYEWFEEEELSE
jgi:transposase-like protein